MHLTCGWTTGQTCADSLYLVAKSKVLKMYPFLGDFLPLFCLHLESGRVGIVAKVVQPLVEITLLLCRLLFLLQLAPAGLDLMSDDPMNVAMVIFM